jgi:ferric-dicitrate binding protein FerR (iron transport regulator)
MNKAESTFMPPSDEVRNLLLKYIAGETDKAESAMVESWLESDPKVFEEFEQLWDLWYAVGTATNVFRFNVDKGWEALLNKRQAETTVKKNGSVLKKIVIWSGGVAAAVLLLIGFVVWQKKADNLGVRRADGPVLSLVTTTQSKEADTAAEGITTMEAGTDPGRRKRIKLPDGSVAWLNGGTTIRYTTGEKKGVRMLYLSGQAFFNITHNAKEPFIVKTKHASIKVLGTRFDVVAYPNDAVTEAVLTGGSIVFTTETAHKKITTHIDPGQKISLNYLSGQLSVIEVDTAFYASWREGRLLFRNETFGEVARAMGHKYNVTFTFKDKSLCGKKLNGYLEKESLQEALEALKLTLQFHYKIIGDSVVIYQ